MPFKPFCNLGVDVAMTQANGSTPSDACELNESVQAGFFWSLRLIVNWAILETVLRSDGGSHGQSVMIK